MKNLTLFLGLFLGLYLTAGAQVIDFVGTGVDWTPSTLNYERNVTLDDIGTIDHITLGACYWGGTVLPANPIVFTHNAVNFNSFLITAGIVDKNKSSIPGYSGYFQHDFTNIGAGGGDVDADGFEFPLVIYSFYAFIYRDLTTPDYYSVEDLQKVEFYENCSNDPYVYEIPILTSKAARDVTVKLGISQLNSPPDTRCAAVTYTAGSVTFSEMIAAPNKGESFYLDPVTLSNVPGDVTKVLISIYSPCRSFDGIEGDSFITNGVVVDVDMGLNHCTFTKGFWGNAKGKDCNKDETQDILDYFDLATNPLIVGKPGASLTINSTQCVLDFLPGGGSSTVIVDKKGNTGDFDCTNKPAVKKNGQLKNGLLTQTIALSLNLRYDPSLGTLPLKQYVMTFDPEDDCDPFSDPDGGEKQFEINPDVIAELGVDNTINDLLELANMALGDMYTGSLSLSEINDAVTAINEGFDECRVLGGFYEESQKSSLAGNMNGETEADLLVYPNPLHDNGSVEFTSVETGQTVVEIYNMMGKKVDVLFNRETKEDVTYNFSFDASNYPPGMYVIYLRNGSTVQKSKISVMK
jgi:hypothetical protein